MVVAITRNQDSGTVHPGPNILSTGDPAAAKRYIKALVQTGSAATDNSATYDEMEVVRQTASLETSELRRLLGAIAEELQTELTTRVNEEFEGFVSLFKDIGAMGEEEFIVLADKVALIQALAHEAELAGRRDLDLLEGTLSKFQANMAEQKRLRLTRHFRDDLNRLEHLLLLGDGKDETENFTDRYSDEAGKENDGTGITLQLAVEFFLRARRLMIAASGKVELPTVLLDRFAQVSCNLHGKLDDALVRVIRAGESTFFREIALVMLRIGRGANLVEALTNDLWKDRLHNIVNKDRFETMLRRNSSVERVIVAMFEELSGAIKSVRTQWFVGLLLGEEMTPPIFCHAILSPTFARLTRELPILFSPALPDVFHSNFRASCQFIEETCVQLLTARELAQLNEENAFQTYAKAWQLNVYFQLRFRDYAQALEEALARCTGEETLTLLGRACAELVSDRIIMRPLVPKFHRLRLQCVARTARDWEERLRILEGEHLVTEREQRQVSEVVRAHAQLVEKTPELIELHSIESLLGTVEGALDKFRALNERFQAQIRQSHEDLIERYRVLSREACLREIAAWNGEEEEEEEEERREDDGSALVLRPFLPLHHYLHLHLPPPGTHREGQSEGERRDQAQGKEEHEPFDTAFKVSLYQECLSSFIRRANELLGQRRKTLINHKRLCAIMKDRRPSTSALSSLSPSSVSVSTSASATTAAEHERDADPEGQLISLLAAIRERVARLRDLGEGLNLSKDSLETHLSALSL